MQTCSVVRRSAPAPLCVTQTYCSAGPTNTLPIVSPTCLLTHPPTHLPTHPPTDAGLLLSSRGGLFRRQRGGVGTTGTARARGELRGRPTPDLTLLTTHYSLLTTHYSLLTTHYSPLTTHHSPLTTHHPLLTTHYSLQASYEAVLLCAALDQAEGQGSGLAVLTFLGGGVFGNKPEWIESAIARAVVRLT